MGVFNVRGLPNLLSAAYRDSAARAISGILILVQITLSGSCPNAVVQPCAHAIAVARRLAGDHIAKQRPAGPAYLDGCVAPKFVVGTKGQAVAGTFQKRTGTLEANGQRLNFDNLARGKTFVRRHGELLVTRAATQ